MLKIDFGSGYNPKKGFKTCDITFSPYLDYVYDKENNIILDLNKNSVDEFYLSTPNIIGPKIVRTASD